MNPEDQLVENVETKTHYLKKIKAPMIIILVIVLLLTSLIFLRSRPDNQKTTPTATVTESQKEQSYASPDAIPPLQVIATELDTPWSIAFLPSGNMLITERKGSVRHIDMNNQLDPEPVAQLAVEEVGEGGLLGIAIDPEFAKNNFVYLYYTYSSSGDNTLNKIVRMIYKDNKLVDEQTLLENIPGASNHNGGRIAFGPDGYLYVTTGDAQEPSLAQDKNSLAGKILRVTRDGKPAPGNPFNNAVYSYGHRNPQGITWDASGQLWSTEHGRSGIQSGLDELNKIEAGANYGWPDSQGDDIESGTKGPVVHSGAFSTWAPGGIAFTNNSLFFAGLRGKAVYVATLSDGVTKEVQEKYKNEFGRIRDVVVGPDRMLYITTSNRDGRAVPGKDDDKVIRLNPTKL